MKIDLLAVGKLKEDYLKEASEDLAASIEKHCSIEIIEVPDERIEEKASPSVIDSIKKTEGKKLMSRIKPSQYVIALAIDGKPLDSPGLKKKITDLRASGRESIAFVIGGSLGLSDEILDLADLKISFSPMTFPHQLARIMLLEQILAAVK